MVTECERVFSAAKDLATQEECLRLIEACECLLGGGGQVVSVRSPACPPTLRVEIEAGVVTTLLGDAPTRRAR
jgi:hypothetical protein